MKVGLPEPLGSSCPPPAAGRARDKRTIPRWWNPSPQGVFGCRAGLGRVKFPGERGCGWAEPPGNLANRCSEPVLLRRQIFPGLLFPLVFRWRCWLEDVEGVWRWGWARAGLRDPPGLGMLGRRRRWCEGGGYL